MRNRDRDGYGMRNFILAKETSEASIVSVFHNNFFEKPLFPFAVAGDNKPGWENPDGRHLKAKAAMIDKQPLLWVWVKNGGSSLLLEYDSPTVSPPLPGVSGDQPEGRMRFLSDCEKQKTGEEIKCRVSFNCAGHNFLWQKRDDSKF